MSHFQNAKGLDASDSSGAAARSALRFALHAPGAAFERVAASCAARSSGAARGLFHELLGALMQVINCVVLHSFAWPTRAVDQSPGVVVDGTDLREGAARQIPQACGCRRAFVLPFSRVP